jgi:sugar lactone lactonase YvrE
MDPARAIAQDAADPVVFSGRSNGLVWVDEMRALFIADSRSGQLLTWFDGWGFDAPVSLAPYSGAGAKLGGVARGADGTLYVARHGGGRDGGIVCVPPDGKPQIVEGVDPSRRRIGVACSAQGRLLSTYYSCDCGSGVSTGGVARVGMDGVEKDLIDNLAKPVGILVRDKLVWVSDQERQAIFRFSLDDRRPAPEPIATVPKPDHICAGPDDSLLVTSHFGRLYRVTAHGQVLLVADRLGSPRGVACDAVSGRAFVTARAAGECSAQSYLYIVPLR